MEKVSVTMPAETLEAILERVQGEEPEAETGEYQTRSEAVRELVTVGLEHEEVVAELETDYETSIEELENEISRLEARVDELTAQLQHEREREAEVEDLVVAAERETTLLERDRQRRQAGAWTRFQWWLWGEPEGEDDRQ